MGKKKATKKPTKVQLAAMSESERLAVVDPDQYNTERSFAAERVVKDMLEGNAQSYVFDEPEDDVSLGSAELYGVEDARDKNGVGGAWVCVRFYVPNLDINTEIDR